MAAIDDSSMISELECTITSEKAPEKKRINFDNEEDLYLLRAVVDKRPMLASNSTAAWKALGEEIGKRTNIVREHKRYADRLSILVTKYSQADAAERWCSGSAQNVTDFKLLLAEAKQFQEEGVMRATQKDAARKREKERLLSDKAKGEQIRKKAMQTMGEKMQADTDSDEDSAASAQKIKKCRRVRPNLDDAMMHKWEKDAERDEKRLKLQEDQLELEREKLREQKEISKIELQKLLAEQRILELKLKLKEKEQSEKNG